MLPKFTTGFTNYQFLESIPQQHREGFTKTMVIQNQYTFNRYLDEIVPAEEAYDADYLADILHRGYGYAVTPEERFGFCDTPTLFLLGKQDNVVGFARDAEPALFITANTRCCCWKMPATTWISNTPIFFARW